MKHSPYTVTDHAVVRFLERVKGMDIDAVRAEIAEKASTALELGASGAVVDGFSYKIAGGRVATVMEANRPCIRTGCVKDKRRSRDDR